jgi:hypothetical protein
LLPYWLLSRLWGRRDTLTIQANLRKTPADEVTVRRSPAGMPVSDDQKQDAEALPAPSGLSIQRIESNSENGDQTLAVNQALVALLDQAGAAIESLSLRKEAPHLKIRMAVKPLSRVDLQAFFSQLSDWLHNPFT